MKKICISPKLGIRNFSNTIQLCKQVKWLAGRVSITVARKLNYLLINSKQKNGNNLLIKENTNLITLNLQERAVESFTDVDALPSKKEVYQMTMVDVKPECWKTYLEHKGTRH